MTVRISVYCSPKTAVEHCVRIGFHEIVVDTSTWSATDREFLAGHLQHVGYNWYYDPKGLSSYDMSHADASRAFIERGDLYDVVPTPEGVLAHVREQIERRSAAIEAFRQLPIGEIVDRLPGGEFCGLIDVEGVGPCSAASLGLEDQVLAELERRRAVTAERRSLLAEVLSELDHQSAATRYQQGILPYAELQDLLRKLVSPIFEHPEFDTLEAVPPGPRVADDGLTHKEWVALKRIQASAEARDFKGGRLLEINTWTILTGGVVGLVKSDPRVVVSVVVDIHGCIATDARLLPR